MEAEMEGSKGDLFMPHLPVQVNVDDVRPALNVEVSAAEDELESRDSDTGSIAVPSRLPGEESVATVKASHGEFNLATSSVSDCGEEPGKQSAVEMQAILTPPPEDTKPGFLGACHGKLFPQCYHQSECCTVQPYK
eukprot:gnl/MRDRNA2_/MRDRNA2_281602_c0_seq1.p1 gnl/MRDRNA2_/MRDRNA2_281602_c0~~gnl/MRDRNA2_/MRDRNA2_281602_c0_seq1.p1  ORF type:complete len:136 (-),score=29.33 gnl/MRDRNA2_/MRDRNA2_281602_c0_seq1:38-445(-)